MTRTYGFEEPMKSFYEIVSPDIAARLWTEPKKPNQHEGHVSPAALAYADSMDVAPVIQSYRDCASFHGRAFDAGGAEKKLRHQAKTILTDLEDAVFWPENENYRSAQAADNPEGVSLEQLTFLATKAVSGFKTAVQDYRQYLGIFFLEDHEYETREHALRRQIILTILEARAALRFIMLRDSQLPGYFQERFEDQKEQFALWMRYTMLKDCRSAMEAHSMVIDQFQFTFDDVATASKKKMDEIVDGLDDLVERMGN